MSLAEVDKGLRDNIAIDSLFDAKPVIIRAFNAAKDKGKHFSKYSADYVEKNEFIYLLIFLRQYAEYFVMFNRMNDDTDMTGGAHKKITFEEFNNSLSQLKDWGVNVEDPEATFAEIDTNNSGNIMFEEFSNWAIKKQLDL